MERRVWHAFYDDGVPVTFPFQDLTPVEALARATADRPDVPAIWFFNRRITYRELGERVDRLAAAFAGLGVGKGTRVAIQLPNLPQTVIAYYAALRAGGQVVMTNPLHVPREIEQQWTDAGCEVAVVSDFAFAQRIAPIRPRLPVRHYVVASIPETLRFPLRVLARMKLARARPPMVAPVRPEATVHPFGALLAAAPARAPAVPVEPDDVALLQYTGGTTGVPKGAALTHRNLSVNAQGAVAWLHLAPDTSEVFLAAVPLFHIFGMTICMNLPVYAGCAMVLLPDPRDVPAVVRAVARRRITRFVGVPAMFAAIAQHPGLRASDLSSLRSCFSGSAPLPLEVLRRFEEVCPAPIVEGFGLTETSPVTHVNPMGRRKVGSIGVPFVETDARIVDLDTGRRDLPPGQEGELLVRGPQVMGGYWNRPDETALVLEDGWLRTGDIARMDEDGYFFIAGRKKDMILVSGFNVYPDEVDGVLAEHPAVLEAASIGVPDERRGEIVKSFVVLKPGASATEADILAHCRMSLAPYKVPRAVEFRDGLPRSPVLKVLRRVLREEESARRRDPVAT